MYEQCSAQAEDDGAAVVTPRAGIRPASFFPGNNTDDDHDGHDHDHNPVASGTHPGPPTPDSPIDRAREPLAVVVADDAERLSRSMTTAERRAVCSAPAIGDEWLWLAFDPDRARAVDVTGRCALRTVGGPVPTVGLFGTAMEFVRGSGVVVSSALPPPPPPLSSLPTALVSGNGPDPPAPSQTTAAGVSGLHLTPDWTVACWFEWPLSPNTHDDGFGFAALTSSAGDDQHFGVSCGLPAVYLNENEAEA